jgi:hypothetical protein
MDTYEQEDISAKKELKKGLSKMAWLILLLSAVQLLCTVVCITAFGFVIYRISSERFAVRNVLATYAKDIYDGNINDAYDMLAPQIKKEMTLTEFRTMVEDEDYLLYDGYRDLYIRGFSSQKNSIFEFGKTRQENTRVMVTGIVYYDCNQQGELEAEVEKRGDSWVIHEFNIYPAADSMKSISYLLEPLPTA